MMCYVLLRTTRVCVCAHLNYLPLYVDSYVRMLPVHACILASVLLLHT